MKVLYYTMYMTEYNQVN